MAHPGNELIAQDREAVTMGDVCREDTSLAKKGMGGQAGSGRRQDQPSVKLMGSVAAGERGVDRAGVGHRADALPGRREVVPRGFDRSATTLAGRYRT